MAGAVLRAGRWAVAELHGDVRLEDLVAMAQRMDARLVVISATAVTEAAAKDLAAALGQALPAPILVGGAGAPLDELVDAASVTREVHPAGSTGRPARSSPQAPVTGPRRARTSGSGGGRRPLR